MSTIDSIGKSACNVRQKVGGAILGASWWAFCSPGTGRRERSSVGLFDELVINVLANQGREPLPSINDGKEKKE
jgi:hypothetical protein